MARTPKSRSSEDAALAAAHAEAMARLERELTPASAALLAADPALAAALDRFRDPNTQGAARMAARVLLTNAGVLAEPETVAVKTPAPIAQGNPLRSRQILVLPETAPPPRPVVHTTRGSAVAREEVRYLWPGRVFADRPTTIMGMAGSGKSTLASWIAATVTVGAPWPDCPEAAEAGDVVILQTEESRGADVAARLLDFGADMERIHFFDSIDRGDGRPRPFRLQFDVDALHVLMDELPATRLIVLDPLGAFLGGLNTRDEVEMREALTPLKEFCEARQVAALLLAHPNKAGDQNIIHRLSGTQALGASARVLWMMSDDPTDPTRKMLSYAKGNPRGLTFKPLAVALAGDQLVFDTDCGDLRAKHVEFLLQRNLKSEALRARRGPQPTKSVDAADLILKILADGPGLRSRLKREVVRQGISPALFERVIRGLRHGGKVVRHEAVGDARIWLTLAPELPLAEPLAPDTPAETVTGAPRNGKTLS